MKLNKNAVLEGIGVAITAFGIAGLFILAWTIL